jgi:hypothetical protein
MVGILVELEMTKRDAVCGRIEILFQHLLAADENHDKPQSRWSMSHPKFELETSII